MKVTIKATDLARLLGLESEVKHLRLDNEALQNMRDEAWKRSDERAAELRGLKDQNANLIANARNSDTLRQDVHYWKDQAQKYQSEVNTLKTENVRLRMNGRSLEEVTQEIIK